MARAWGPWTEVKLDALAQYLSAFNVAARKAKGTLYLDLFAGSAENRRREGGERIAGSVERALRCSPPFARVVACELQERVAEGLRTALTTQFPGRDIEVLTGDCNQKVPEYLHWLARNDQGWRFAPTFAFVDQYAAEIQWSTLEALARFRAGDRKTELWMYFGDSFIPRAGGVHEGPPQLPEFASRVDAMFGTDQWRELQEGRSRGQLAPHEYKAELVNLMRWRLQEELNYATTLPLTIRNSHNRGIYTMIFATDADVGDRIMRSVFHGAERDLAAMTERAKIRRREDREAARGVHGLFSAVPDASWRPDDAPVSPLDPPQPPWRLSSPRA